MLQQCGNLDRLVSGGTHGTDNLGHGASGWKCVQPRNDVCAPNLAQCSSRSERSKKGGMVALGRSRNNASISGIEKQHDVGIVSGYKSMDIHP